MNRTAGIGFVALVAAGMAMFLFSCGGGGSSSDGSGLVIELTWSTPSDPDETDTNGTDFDLHFKDEGATWWFDSTTGPGSDCFKENPNPDWGVAGDSSDDPLLAPEDGDGAGPEIITLNHPSVGMTYSVGVHSSLDRGFGPSSVSIQIYVDGVLEYELLDEVMSQGAVWEVVDIGWTHSGPVFETIDVQVPD